MDQQLQAINDYYTNLQYNEINKEEITAEISTLSKTIKFKDFNDISERFLEIASVIEKNLRLFQSACKHVDIVTTIIEYLTNFGVKFMFLNDFEEEYTRDDVILSVMFTLLNVCEESQIMQFFLKEAILKNFILNGIIQYERLKFATDPFNEMILLEDSDLYAVISYFRVIDSSLFYLHKIWIQECIKEKFLWLIKEYFKDLTFPINVFRSRKELLTAPYKSKIISIWSEDIIAAKNLATSLHKEVVFINTHMDFCGGNALLPYGKIFDKTLDKLSYKQQNFDVDKYVIKSKELKIPTYNLFYYGKWQLPVENTYWKYNETLWAHATSHDIKRCIDSAEKGFKIWSSKYITSRNQILSNLASTLEYSGKILLADRILKWIKLSYIYETSLFYSQCGRLEITQIRKPRGIIILKEKDETVLFDRLIQILIAGNSVIVICDGKNSCSLAQYCDIFSTSEIPSGVINLLSNDKLKTLELSLCTTEYDFYAERFFSKEKLDKTYLNLTIPYQIILPIE